MKDNHELRNHYCLYCWKPVTPDQKRCDDHNLSPVEIGERRIAKDYNHARRIKPLFDKEVDILYSDILLCDNNYEFLSDNFINSLMELKASILRKYSSSDIQLEFQKNPDSLALKLGHSKRTIRFFNETGNMNEVLYHSLIRAEAWHRAQKKRCPLPNSVKYKIRLNSSQKNKLKAYCKATGYKPHVFYEQAVLSLLRVRKGAESILSYYVAPRSENTTSVEISPRLDNHLQYVAKADSARLTNILYTAIATYCK